MVCHKVFENDIDFLETTLQSLHSRVGERDLTKRMILSVAISFVQQLIDNLTLKVSYVNIDLESFYPSGATVA